MNWAQFKDPASHMCVAGTVVASWSLTQEVASFLGKNSNGTQILFNFTYRNVKYKMKG